MCLKRVLSRYQIAYYEMAHCQTAHTHTQTHHIHPILSFKWYFIYSFQYELTCNYGNENLRQMDSGCSMVHLECTIWKKERDVKLIFYIGHLILATSRHSKYQVVSIFDRHRLFLSRVDDPVIIFRILNKQAKLRQYCCYGIRPAFKRPSYLQHCVSLAVFFAEPWFIHGPKHRKENNLLSLEHSRWLFLVQYANLI